jgi:hypothetical protein
MAPVPFSKLLSWEAAASVGNERIVKLSVWILV